MDKINVFIVLTRVHGYFQQTIHNFSKANFIQ